MRSLEPISRVCREARLGQVQLGPHVGHDIPGHGGPGVAPAISDVILHIRDFLIVKFPGEARHYQRRWPALARSYVSAGKDQMRDRGGVGLLNNSVVPQGWEVPWLPNTILQVT